MYPQIRPRGTSQGLFYLQSKGAYMEGTTFELKYCERCGALGLRPPDSPANYCEPCARILFMLPTSLHRGLRRLSYGVLHRQERQPATSAANATPSLGSAVRL